MPILGALLVSLFTGLAGFFVEFIAKKFAMALAYIATLGVVIVVMLGLLTTVVKPLADSLFSYPYSGWMGLAFPSPTTGICITALATVWAGTVLYAWQREALRIAASV